MFTELERKLIWLALDEAAQPGEIRNSAVKLVESLRRRGLRPEAIISGGEWESSPGAEERLRQARSKRMPFGKHRGKRLDEAPLSYLRWVISECGNISVALREAIHIVLKAGGAYDGRSN